MPLVEAGSGSGGVPASRGGDGPRASAARWDPGTSWCTRAPSRTRVRWSSTRGAGRRFSTAARACWASERPSPTPATCSGTRSASGASGSVEGGALLLVTPRSSCQQRGRVAAARERAHAPPRQRPLAVRQPASSDSLGAREAASRRSRARERPLTAARRPARRRDAALTCASMSACGCWSSTRSRPKGSPISTRRGFHVDQISSKLPRDALHDADRRLRGHHHPLVDGGDRRVPGAAPGSSASWGAPASGWTTSTSTPARATGVVVVNAPYGNVVSAAEHTVGMLLALVRKIPFANDSAEARGLGPRASTAPSSTGRRSASSGWARWDRAWRRACAPSR